MSIVVRNVCLSVANYQGTAMEKMDQSIEKFVEVWPHVRFHVEMVRGMHGAWR